MIDAQSTVLINGEATRSVDFADRGLQYGDGVFTTLTVQDGIPLFLNRHLARLQADAAKLNLPCPAVELLADEARHLAASQAQAVLKMMLTRGVGGRGYRCPEASNGTRILSLHPHPNYPADLAEHGTKARLCALRLGINPHLAGIKHLNRLEQVLARAEWQDDDIREGVLLDYEGFVVEGVMSNLLVLNGNRLTTPLLDRSGVAGVMRGLVLEAARDLGLAVEETRIRPETLFAADSVLLTNSVIGIWPVRELDGHRFTINPIIPTLRQRIDAGAQA